MTGRLTKGDSRTCVMALVRFLPFPAYIIVSSEVWSVTSALIAWTLPGLWAVWVWIALLAVGGGVIGWLRSVAESEAEGETDGVASDGRLFGAHVHDSTKIEHEGKADG